MEFTATNKSELIEDYILKELLPKYKPGDKFPSELDLSQMLNTSRPTIHKVLSGLTSRGLLHRRNGAGTFISPPKLKSDTVLAVLSSPSESSPTHSPSWFTPDYILEEFGASASKFGIGVQITYLHPDERSYVETVEILMKSKAGAYIFTELGGYGPIIRELRERGALCIARGPAPSETFHCVYGLLKDGVKEGIRALLASGCKSIANFTLTSMNGMPSRYEIIRQAAYEEALKEAGLPISPELIRVCGGFPHDGYMETRKMLKEGVRPDGIFGGSDMRTFGIIQALKEAGLRIPEDVSILGSDNLPECLEQTPELSTVEYPLRKIGGTMFEILQEANANPSGGIINRGLKCEFIRRGSIRKP